MFPVNVLEVKDVELPLLITVAPLILLPNEYEVPSIGPGLGAVALVLLNTKYLLGAGDAAVNDPDMVFEVIVLVVKEVGCAVGVVQGTACVTQIVNPLAVSSPL